MVVPHKIMRQAAAECNPYACNDHEDGQHLDMYEWIFYHSDTKQLLNDHEKGFAATEGENAVIPGAAAVFSRSVIAKRIVSQD